MKEIRYNANLFNWVKDSNTFYAISDHLYPDWAGYNGPAFPSDKRQFVIFNDETGGFRRFRFVREESIEIVNNGTEYVFESEDGFFARILVEYARDVIETISDNDIVPLIDMDVVKENYVRYYEFANNLPEPDYEYHIDDPTENRVRPMYLGEFAEHCARNSEFAQKWNEGNENILPN